VIQQSLSLTSNSASSASEVGFMQSRSIEDYPTGSKQSQPGVATAQNDSRIGAHISIMEKM
jgi:hypothetical protein